MSYGYSTLNRLKVIAQDSGLASAQERKATIKPKKRRKDVLVEDESKT